MVLWKKLWYYSKLYLTIVNYSSLKYFLLGLGLLGLLRTQNKVIPALSYQF